MPRRKRTPETEAETVLNLSENGDGSNDTPKPRQTRTRRPRAKSTKEVPAETLQALHEKVSGNTYMVIAGVLPVKPTVDELDGTIIPLERIAIRHAPDPLKNANPDQRDLFESVRHIVQYLVRGYLIPAVMMKLSQRDTPKYPTPPQPPKTPQPVREQVENPDAEPINLDAERRKRTPKGKPSPPAAMQEALQGSQSEEQLRKLHGYLVASTPKDE